MKLLFQVWAILFIIITNVYAEPIAISTQAELENINNNLSGNYILVNDIDMTGTTYTHSVIASGVTAFTGTFDGGGFVIRNLTINSTNRNVGLFGKIGNGGSVANLGIENAVVHADANTGVLAGVADVNSSIDNCYSTGTITAAGNYAGGLIGNAACSIMQSYSLAGVTGIDYVGGLAGYNKIPDIVSQTYSAGQVTGTGSNVGGLFGKSSLAERIAVVFNGDTDYLTLSQPLPIFNSSFTIEMWVYFNDDGRSILLGDYNLTGRLNINFERYTGGQLRIYWNGGNPNHLTNSNVVQTQKWHHIVYQRDKTLNVFRIFVDGVLINTFSNAGADLVATIPHRLGRDSRTGETAFNGKMRDVRIWNYVRTPAEIQSDMFDPLTGSEAGLVLYLKFDEGAGTNVNDSSSRNNDAYSTTALNWNTTILMADSVWDVNTSNQQTSSGGIAKTTAQMQDVNTFIPLGWDFNDVWHFLNEGYPIFLWQAKQADLTNDGAVDFSDLAILAADWLKQSADISAKSIENPYQDVNWTTTGQYKANLHTHTNQSDGSDTPATVIDGYNNMGYDILSITDHDTTAGSPSPTWPWTAFGRDPATLGMIAIKGNEISKGHHTLSYFCDYGDASETLTEDAIIAIGNQGGLAVMAHPIYTNHYLGTRGLPAGQTWTVQKYADLYNQYDHLLGMEVYNRITSLDAHRPVWDGVLTLTMPQRQVLGFSNDDSHSSGHRYYGYNVFLLPEFTEQAVRNSMEAGSFYFAYSFSQGGSPPAINSINVNLSAYTITINASNYEQIVWFSRGQEVATGEIFTLDDELGYVRAEITGAGGVAFTQPFGIVNPCGYIYQNGLNYPGDINKDCVVNFNDLDIFADQWLEKVWY